MGGKGRTARSIGLKRCSGDGQLRRRAEGVVRVRRSEREQVSVGGASELSVRRIGETKGRFWEDGVDVACPAAGCSRAVVPDCGSARSYARVHLKVMARRANTQSRKASMDTTERRSKRIDELKGRQREGGVGGGISYT